MRLGVLHDLTRRTKAQSLALLSRREPGLKEFSVGLPIPRAGSPTPVYMFQPAWRWTQKEFSLMARELVEPVLHVPCGVSDAGDIRIDLYTRADVKADMNQLPIRSRSFKTVLMDPPWINPRKWDMRWTKEAARIATKKIIIRSGIYFHTIPKPWKLKRSWFVVRHGTGVINMWYVWELEDETL